MSWEDSFRGWDSFIYCSRSEYSLRRNSLHLAVASSFHHKFTNDTTISSPQPQTYPPHNTIFLSQASSPKHPQHKMKLSTSSILKSFGLSRDKPDLQVPPLVFYSPQEVQEASAMARLETKKRANSCGPTSSRRGENLTSAQHRSSVDDLDTKTISRLATKAELITSIMSLNLQNPPSSTQSIAQPHVTSNAIFNYHLNQSASAVFTGSGMPSAPISSSRQKKSVGKRKGREWEETKQAITKKKSKVGSYKARVVEYVAWQHGGNVWHKKLNKKWGRDESDSTVPDMPMEDTRGGGGQTKHFAEDGATTETKVVSFIPRLSFFNIILIDICLRNLPKRSRATVVRTETMHIRHWLSSKPSSEFLLIMPRSIGPCMIFMSTVPRIML